MSPINQSEINDILWRARETFCAAIENRLLLRPGWDENQGTQE